MSNKQEVKERTKYTLEEFLSEEGKAYLENLALPAGKILIKCFLDVTSNDVVLIPNDKSFTTGRGCVYAVGSDVRDYSVGDIICFDHLGLTQVLIPALAKEEVDGHRPGKFTVLEARAIMYKDTNEVCPKDPWYTNENIRKKTKASIR